MVQELSPKEIVAQLDHFIVGQDKAKRALAIALRNRYRRLQLDDDMKKEVTPKNLLMIGPTGVGKTELARRLATLVGAPFAKVEATKFTEVGYVGRDVESMVRDLVENARQLVREDKEKAVWPQARKLALEEIAKIMKPGIKKKVKNPNGEGLNLLMRQFGGGIELPDQEIEEVNDEILSSRKALLEKLETGLLDNREITVELEEKPLQMAGQGAGFEQLSQLQSMFENMQPTKRSKHKLTVGQAIEKLTKQHASNLVNKEEINDQALELAQSTGIIFIDEIDKIAKSGQGGGQVSREGVQRDILPIVEGSQVQTKYGIVQTDHILFIASGAFHVAKPSDLMPELQGRFPIRVELQDLTQEDFERILTQPKNSLLKQYKAMLATENVEVVFTKEAVSAMARIACQVNETTENIGARRLHTILETVLEELLFEAADMQMGTIQITQQYVEGKLASIQEDPDLSRYVL